MREEIDEAITNYLSDKEWPVTTEDVADGVDISWNTAQVHLIQLREEGRVKYRKVGRQNQWWLNRNYEEDFEGKNPE